MQTNFFIVDWEQQLLFWYLGSMNRASFLSRYLLIEKRQTGTNQRVCQVTDAAETDTYVFVCPPDGLTDKIKKQTIIAK